MTLANPIPLRKTSDWDDFERVEPIPYGFGRITSIAIPLNASRNRFVWLAGVNGGVDSVRVGGNQFNEWEAINGTDPSGAAATLIQTNRTIDDDLIVAGRGHLSPRTGGLIQNPGEVIRFIYQLYGKPEPIIDLFESECARRSITVAGLLDDRLSGRAMIASILGSIGARGSDAVPGYAFFYPDVITQPAVATLDNRSNLDASYTLDRIVTVLRVNFAFDHAAGKYRRTLVYRAMDAIATYGEVTREIDAQWIDSPRVAEQMARRLLEHEARPVWELSTEINASLYPGQPVTINHDQSPSQNDAIVLNSVICSDTGASRISMELGIGQVTNLKLDKLGTAFDPDSQVFDIRRVNGQVEIVITDDGDPPAALSGASVTLDDDVTVTTDRAGVARFPSYLLPPGTEHDFLVEHPDFEPLSFSREV